MVIFRWITRVLVLDNSAACKYFWHVIFDIFLIFFWGLTCVCRACDVPILDLQMIYFFLFLVFRMCVCVCVFFWTGVSYVCALVCGSTNELYYFNDHSGFWTQQV